MYPDVHRIEHQPTSYGGAVRRAGPRRQRGGGPKREFHDEIDESDGEAEDEPSPSPVQKKNRAVSPPTEEDGGTRINVVG